MAERDRERERERDRSRAPDVEDTPGTPTTTHTQKGDGHAGGNATVFQPGNPKQDVNGGEEAYNQIDDLDPYGFPVPTSSAGNLPVEF